MNLPTPPPSHPMLQQSTVLTMGLLNTDTHTTKTAAQTQQTTGMPLKSTPQCLGCI